MPALTNLLRTLTVAPRLAFLVVSIQVLPAAAPWAARCHSGSSDEMRKIRVMVVRGQPIFIVHKKTNSKPEIFLDIFSPVSQLKDIWFASTMGSHSFAKKQDSTGRHRC